MEISSGSLEASIRQRVRQTVSECKTKAQSCAVRSANALRNAALDVLRGSRSGRTYRLPGTRRTYVASAPGEPPAPRTGTLRRSWSMSAKSTGDGTYTAGIYSDVPYASYLEDGTSRMAPRPYRDAIIEKATPKIEEIFSELIK